VPAAAAAALAVSATESVPDGVIDGADEVELIDMSPHALRQRMKHGNIYPLERAERALESFVREGNLVALREMALRNIAQVCDTDIEEYNLIRRGWRMANRYYNELLAVFVEIPGWAYASPEETRALAENLGFAEDLGAEPVRIQASDVAKELMQIAHAKNVGIIIIGHSRHRGLHQLLRGSILQKRLRLGSDVDVDVVADREHRELKTAPVCGSQWASTST
jgi:two-component system, OmpR family, sensor histidine kinase KdpD